LPLFTASLETYEKTTKYKLLTHPLATQLQSCDSPADVLSVLQDLIQQFGQSSSGYQGLGSWLGPTVNVLFAFSAALGEGVGLVCFQSLSHDNLTSDFVFQVFSPSKVIFAGIGVLLLVNIPLGFSAQVLMTTWSVRRLRMSRRATMCLLASLHESRISSSV
jgi:hypothetical protein